MKDENKTKPQLMDELRELRIKTQEIILEKNTQNMEALGMLAAGIAHEFNNVIGAILGYAELMELFDTSNNAEVKSRIDGILRGAYKARDLVKQIQALGRRSSCQRLPLNMDLIVKESLKFQKHLFPTTIEVEKKLYYTGVPVLADPVQIHQILIHLFNNAVESMGQDGGVLTVTLEEMNNDGKRKLPYADLPRGLYAVLTVTDTGKGIPSEMVETIFDPCFTSGEKDGKAGLGLTIVRGIVEQLDGKIEVNSNPGKGCAVKVILPVVKRDNAILEKKGSDDLPMGRESILWVDDEKDLQELVEKILRRLGYKVTVTSSGREALDLLRIDPEAFDLVITDMMMPNMTGLKLAEKIVNIRPRIPILLFTGDKNIVTPESATIAGVCDMILKPVTIEKLAVGVRRALDEK